MDPTVVEVSVAYPDNLEGKAHEDDIFREGESAVRGNGVFLAAGRAAGAQTNPEGSVGLCQHDNCAPPLCICCGF